MNARRILVTGAAALLLGGAFSGAALADTGPPNDNRADATAVGSLPYTTSADTSGATTEADESSKCAPIGRSVWWRLDAPTASDIIVDTLGSDYDTVVDVYKQTPSGMEPVACNDDAYWDWTSRVSFSPQPGSTYFIQVAGHESGGGTLALSIAASEPLGNDAFSDAYALAGPQFSIGASTSGATTEAGEPIPCDRLLIARTVWFQWTAPATGRLWLETNDRVLGVYTGETLGSLASVGCGRGYSRSDVTAGETYYIQVGVNDLGAPGMFTLYGYTDATVAAPANDNLADAENIGGLNEFHTANNSSATTESGEPSCADSYLTVWYRYTAAEDGPLVASSEGSNVDTTVAVYRGSNYDDIQSVSCNDEAAGTSTSRAGFVAQAGETYLIQVGDYWGDGGSIRIGLLKGAAVGDAPAGATVTTDDQGPHEVSASVAGAAAYTEPTDDGRATGVWVNGFLVFAGAEVGDEPDGHYVFACGYVVFVGTCTGTGAP